MTFSIDNPRGGCNNPPHSENMFGKNPQDMRTKVKQSTPIAKIGKIAQMGNVMPN